MIPFQHDTAFRDHQPGLRPTNPVAQPKKKERISVSSPALRNANAADWQ
jgi:hypothetical protein